MISGVRVTKSRLLITCSSSGASVTVERNFSSSRAALKRCRISSSRAWAAVCPPFFSLARRCRRVSTSCMSASSSSALDHRPVPRRVDRAGRMEHLRGIEGADQQAEQIAAPGRVHPQPRGAAAADGDVGAQHELVFGIGGFFRLDTDCSGRPPGGRGSAAIPSTASPTLRVAGTGRPVSRVNRVFLPVWASPRMAIFIRWILSR